MKTLYIMRPAQKDVKSASDDFFLTLTNKGEADVNNVANKLFEKGVKPDLIVSSPSLRTEITSMILARKLNLDKSIVYNEVLYQGYLEELIEAVNFTFHTVDTLILVGHNPLLTNFANYFVGYKEIKMAEVLKIEFDVSSWVEIDTSNAELVEVIEP